MIRKTFGKSRDLTVFERVRRLNAELNRLGIEFVSFRENLDTGGALGRAVIVIVSAVAELERNLIVERVKAGMRRAKLEGRHVGRRVARRAPLPAAEQHGRADVLFELDLALDSRRRRARYDVADRGPSC